MEEDLILYIKKKERNEIIGKGSLIQLLNHGARWLNDKILNTPLSL